jgi:hypothetical protein
MIKIGDVWERLDTTGRLRVGNLVIVESVTDGGIGYRFVRSDSTEHGWYSRYEDEFLQHFRLVEGI